VRQVLSLQKNLLFHEGGSPWPKYRSQQIPPAWLKLSTGILDKGIVIDAWVKVSLVGIELLSIEARVVIASVETYLKYAEAIGLTASAAAPA